ncbi:MAG: MFS transporter [Candidatus Thorarchaeota archaeon]|nr:MFS transporter [Candidatus Thorarchaeota archaeon]
MMTEAHRTQPSTYRWVILTLVWLVYFAFGLVLSSIPPLVNVIAADLSLTYSEMGVVLGSVILMYVPLSIPVGISIDRFGQKRMITVGLLLISASALLRSLVFDFQSLLFIVLLFGFGGPTVSVGLAKVVASAFEGRERGLASGLYMTGAAVGSASALALTNSFVLPFVGTWRNVFSFYGIIGFLIALGWILFAKEQPVDPTSRPNETPLVSTLQSLLSNRNVWLVAIIGSAAFLVFYGFGNWLPTLLEEKGMDPVAAGLWASLPVWLGLLGSAVIPGIASAGSRKPIIVSLLLVEGACVYLSSLANGIPLLVALALYGIVSGAHLPLLLVVMMDLPAVGAKYTGIASGLFFSIGEIMGFGGPILVGVIRELTSSFVPALFLLGLIVEFMIVLAVVLKEE